MLEFFKNKRVFITGHTGFKGAWLSRILVLVGAKVCGYALNPPTFPSMFDILELEDDIKSIIGDIRDYKNLEKAFFDFQPEIVIHLAAQPLVRDSYENPMYTYETNVMGTVNILECVRKADFVKSFLNVTTDKVYDNKEWDRAYKEDDYLDGYDPYSNSKSCSELVTHSYKRSFLNEKGLAVSTARAGNVIGGGDFAKDRIIPDCVRAAIANKKVTLRSPNSIRPYEHVLEPLKVYLMILQKQYENKDKYSGAFNVGPDLIDCITTGELVELFKKYWGNDFDYEVMANNGPHEANFLKLDCQKLKEIYDWQPNYNIEKAVEKTVEWFKAYEAGEDMQKITDEQIKDFFVRK